MHVVATVRVLAASEHLRVSLATWCSDVLRAALRPIFCDGDIRCSTPGLPRRLYPVRTMCRLQPSLLHGGHGQSRCYNATGGKTPAAPLGSGSALVVSVRTASCCSAPCCGSWRGRRSPGGLPRNHQGLVPVVPLLWKFQSLYGSHAATAGIRKAAASTAASPGPCDPYGRSSQQRWIVLCPLDVTSATPRTARGRCGRRPRRTGRRPAPALRRRAVPPSGGPDAPHRDPPGPARRCGRGGGAGGGRSAFRFRWRCLTQYTLHGGKRY